MKITAIKSSAYKNTVKRIRQRDLDKISRREHKQIVSKAEIAGKEIVVQKIYMLETKFGSKRVYETGSNLFFGCIGLDSEPESKIIGCTRRITPARNGPGIGLNYIWC